MAKAASKRESLIEVINSIVKAAEDAAEQGHVENQGDSGTSHPSKSVDDGTTPAETGAHAAANEADIKANVPGQAVDEAKPAPEGSSSNELANAKPTGEDPAHETESLEPKMDPGADQNIEGKTTELPGTSGFDGKYSSVREAAADVLKFANAFLAKVAACDFRTATAPAATTTTTTTQSRGAKEASKTAAAADVAAVAGANPDEAAGEAAAAQVLNNMEEIKQAQSELLCSVASDAVSDADRLAALYRGMLDGSGTATGTKRAEEVTTPEGADDVAYGGSDEGETAAVDDGTAVEGGDGMDPVVAQIINELIQAGIDPQVLASIDPEDLAQAVAELQAGGEGGNTGGDEEIAASPEAAGAAPAGMMM